MNILVVDDERIILRGIARMVREYPGAGEVRTAGGAEEALEILRSFCADAVITDIRMPETDGLELIRLASEEELCRRFVILSGYSDFEYARTAIRYHVLDYLLKPVDPDDLTRVLDLIAADLSAGGNPEEDAPAPSLISAVTKALQAEKPPAEKSAPGSSAAAGPVSGSSAAEDPAGNRRRGGKAEFFPEDDADRTLLRVWESLNSAQSFSPLLKPALLAAVRGYADPSLDLGQIAESLFVNANYLSGIISQETGVSFYAFLRTFRVAAAKEALRRDPRQSVRTIAEKCGFGTENNFFRTFKQLTGKTPKEYRSAEG